MPRFVVGLLVLLVLVAAPMGAHGSAPVGCDVKGFVITAEGAPVMGATVRVTTATDAATVVSGADGGFSVTVGEGAGTVCARKSGYLETCLAIEACDGQQLRLHLILRPSP